MLIGRAQSFTQPAVYLLKVSDLYYVGSTSNLKNRVRQHVDMLRKGTHRNPRLQAMWDKHNSMEVRVIAAVDETQLLFYEQQWVNILRRHRNVANFGSEVSRPRLGVPTVYRWVFGRKDGNRPKPPKPNWRVING